MKNKPKVFVQIVDTLAMGGTERMAVNISGVMCQKGWESHLIVSRRGGGLENVIPHGVRVHFLNKKAFYDLASLGKLIQLVRSLKPQIVHAHSTSIYWAVLIKILSGNFKLVWHDHFGLSEQLDKYPRKEMVMLAKWIDGFLTVNQKLTNYWRQLLPHKAKSIKTIPNFPFVIQPSLAKFQKFTFLNVANYRPQKDQLTLIEACRILSEKGKIFDVLLIGEPVDLDWKAQMHQLIDFYHLQDKIHLLGPKENAHTYMAESHVGVLSSESEGLPVALLEYGLSELPVISTDVGDCIKVIPAPEYGWIIPPKDPHALYKAMLETMEKYDVAKQKGQALKEKVQSEFGEEAFFKAYTQFFQ